MTAKRFTFAVMLALFGAAACSGEASNSGDNGVAAELRSGDAFCAGQKAQLPASGATTQTITATRSDGFRFDSEAYVSYSVTQKGLYLNLFFAPDLPAAFTTEQARAGFHYAIIRYDLPQSGGAPLTLLESDPLELSAFERLEVIDGVLSWRLTRTSADHYLKRLATKDLDSSVDPLSCVMDDILGQCGCEFSGPPTTVTLDGTMPI